MNQSEWGVTKQEVYSVSIYSPSTIFPSAYCANLEYYAQFHLYYHTNVSQHTAQNLPEKEKENTPATFGLSASKSYLLFPPSRQTTSLKLDEAFADCVHAMTERMWYDDVFMLSRKPRIEEGII